jgi:hypothetical protein
MPAQVTASQLSLLEATMAKMERVAVWSLMSGGGSGRDVFTVSVRAPMRPRHPGGLLLVTTLATSCTVPASTTLGAVLDMRVVLLVGRWHCGFVLTSATVGFAVSACACMWVVCRKQAYLGRSVRLK